MNFSFSLARTRFSNGAAKVRIIFKLPNLFSKIFQFLFLRQSFQELFHLFSDPFFKGAAKVRIIFKLPNFFSKIFRFLFLRQSF